MFWDVRIGPKGQYRKHNKCKECCLKNINTYDFDTIIPLLKELNFPYIKKEFAQLRFFSDIPPSKRMVISRYLSKMKLASFRDYTFEDSDLLNKINEEQEKEAMRRRGFNV